LKTILASGSFPKGEMTDPNGAALTVSNPACQRGSLSELAISRKNPARFPAILQDGKGALV
jgi:hypothetical protein